ncbi:hypothetical protein DXC70_09280, partial [Bifidobacterium bifidum]
MSQFDTNWPIKSGRWGCGRFLGDRTE